MNNNKGKIKKIKQELLIMNTLNIKLNYSELSKIYQLDRRTIKKYNNGYDKNKRIITRVSKLDELKEEIKEKLKIPGATISGVYQYFSENKNIGTYSNFNKYVKKNNLRLVKNNKPKLRFETDYGQQLQFDWKEDMKMISKYGELFDFNIFSATSGASRLHVFIYSKFKTRIDVQRCLVKVFQYILEEFLKNY